MVLEGEAVDGGGEDAAQGLFGEDLLVHPFVVFVLLALAGDVEFDVAELLDLAPVEALLLDAEHGVLRVDRRVVRALFVHFLENVCLLLVAHGRHRRC